MDSSLHPGIEHIKDLNKYLLKEGINETFQLQLHMKVTSREA